MTELNYDGQRYVRIDRAKAIAMSAAGAEVFWTWSPQHHATTDDEPKPCAGGPETKMYDDDYFWIIEND